MCQSRPLSLKMLDVENLDVVNHFAAREVNADANMSAPYTTTVGHGGS